VTETGQSHLLTVVAEVNSQAARILDVLEERLR
jgi:hypothetical protein